MSGSSLPPCPVEDCPGCDARACRDCAQEVPLVHRRYPRGHRRIVNTGVCRPCQTRRQKASKAKRAEHYRQVDRRAEVLRRYGVTAAELEALGDVCHLCGDPGIDVDHCHDTGKVRGLLCKPCNRALGGFRDDPELLRRAARYVEEARDAVVAPALS